MTDVSELELTVARFLAVAEEVYWDDYWNDDRSAVGRAAFHLVSVVHEIDRLRRDEGLDEQLDAYSWMIRRSAHAVWKRLPAFEAGSADPVDIVTYVVHAKVHARSLRDVLVELRGGGPPLSVTNQLPYRWRSPRPAPPADSPAPVVRTASATPTARRAILLAVLVLPPAHRVRFREEWMATVLDRPRLQQLRYALSFLLGAYATRQALLETDGHDGDLPGAEPPE